MAIKIKKKSAEPAGEEVNEELDGETGEEGEAYGAPELVDDHEDIDVVIPEFVQRKASPLENPRTLLGVGAVTIVVILAGYYGWKFVEQQKVDNSAHLNDAFNAAWRFTADGPEMKAFNERGLKADFQPFENATKKSEAVYAGADAAAGKGSDAIVSTAKLMKAGAAAQLGKFDEAIELYNAALTSTPGKLEQVPIRQGLSDAYAAKQQWDKALEQVDAILATDEGFAKSMKYRKARLLEKSGKVKEAKELYHEIIEGDPSTPFKSDIERRLATL